jgi:hypothetical protein
MTSAVDQKTYWSLLETVRWMCTRDQERVAEMRNMSEEDGIAPALFGGWPQWYLRSLQGLPETNSDADGAAAAPQASKPRVDRPFMMDPSLALDDLLRKLQSTRLQMIAIRCGERSGEPTVVPPVELNDLMVRLAPGHPVAPVGLWSRSRRDTLVWRSPQFLRADVILLWPAEKTKPAAVRSAILQHLREIMTPGAPLTKLQAQHGAWPKCRVPTLGPLRRHGRSWNPLARGGAASMVGGRIE